MTCTTSRGVEFIIDNSDAELVVPYRWYMMGAYVGRCVRGVKLRLHEYLLGKAPKGFEWDHVNQAKLDNRRSNLRLVTRRQNMRNIGPHKDGRSGHKGVHWQAGKWTARIRVNDREKYLGRFVDLPKAVEARKQAELQYWGET